jgi:hypothetical protein
MSVSESKHEITEDVIKAARENLNGWVYKIEGSFDPTEHVPPTAIVGAWKVNEYGNLVGDFIPNPKYKPRLSKDEK